MSLKNCQIVFDNPYNTYYPGQTIKGKVHLLFDSIKEIRGISIKFEGEAKTKWAKGNRRQRRRRRNNFTGNEEYFKFQYYLLGSETGHKIQLPPGGYCFPFLFGLPPILPSSFEGKFGHIRYTVMVTLDIPWKVNQEYKTAFTVVSAVDLNLNPAVKTPVDVSFEKSFESDSCTGCCIFGTFTFRGSLPFTGYVSGQEIPLTIDFDNDSNVLIQNFCIDLKRKVLFFSQRPSRRTRKLEETVKAFKIELNSGYNTIRTLCLSIMIPALPPSNLDHCSLIDLEYEILVTANFSRPYGSAYIRIPIVIGTIPLTSQITMNSNNTSQIGDSAVGFVTNSIEPSAPSGPSNSDTNDDPEAPPPPYHSLYPNMPLPTLTESEFNGESMQDENDDNEPTQCDIPNFAPRYPVYTFTSS